MRTVKTQRTKIQRENNQKAPPKSDHTQTNQKTTEPRTSQDETAVSWNWEGARHDHEAQHERIPTITSFPSIISTATRFASCPERQSSGELQPHLQSGTWAGGQCSRLSRISAISSMGGKHSWRPPSATTQELTRRTAAPGGKGAGKNKVCTGQKWKSQV